MMLARDGHEVTVLERAPAAVPASAREAWESWERRGVPQLHQPHNLLPRDRQILERHSFEPMHAPGASTGENPTRRLAFRTEKPARNAFPNQADRGILRRVFSERKAV